MIDYIIGITGKSGSGKNQWVKQLGNIATRLNPLTGALHVTDENRICKIRDRPDANEGGYIHIDIDVYVHEAYRDKKIQRSIRRYFGDRYDLICNDNDEDIDRKKLAPLIFSDPEIRKYIFDVTSLYVYKKIDDIIRNCDGTLILNHAALPQMDKLTNLFDETYLIVRDDERRIASLMKRDNVSREYILERDKLCPEYNPKDFDYVIYNPN